MPRMRGRIDVPWMLTFRKMLNELFQAGTGILIYPMVDSSPQGGRDYEMVVMNMIQETALITLHGNIVKLESRRVGGCV